MYRFIYLYVRWFLLYLFVEFAYSWRVPFDCLFAFVVLFFVCFFLLFRLVVFPLFCSFLFDWVSISFYLVSLSLSVWFVLFFFSFSLFACVFLMLCLLCIIVFVVFFVLFVRLVVCLLADPLFDCVSVLSSGASLMFLTIGNVVFDNTLYISLRL